MGFLTLPREWEGQHEAFPAHPPQFDGRGLLSGSGVVVLLGSIGGVALNLSRALRRKPLSLAVLNGIGLCTIPSIPIDIIIEERGRRGCIEDIRAILKADNKTLPPRKYIKFTKENTPETTAVICGGLAVLGLLAYRRAPNGPKAGVLSVLGAFSAGSFFGTQLSNNAQKKLNGAAMMKYQIACLKGSQIYSERTRKPPDEWLYESIAGLGQGISRHQDSNPWSLLRGINQESDDETIAIIDEDNVTTASSLLTAFPLPPGSEPHMAVKTQDGTKIYAPQRDYEWNPTSAQTGLEILQDHLEELSTARSKQAQTAEYLWNMIARREADKFPPYARNDEAEEIILERKALELLTSIHRQVYSQIADLDWCIANTKKLILQFQTDGKWVPSTSVQSSVLSEARDKILENIRLHKKNLEVQQTTFANEENIKMMAISEDEKEDIRRALRENLAATTRLLEDLENEVEKGQ
ncbi:uncharacterized protein PV09_01844 [Verruconis gallopava]|uniref:Uncharacterized protein n=1 Tax=Verruconis gallopava TaxID=253628 RepID=A0A0D2AN46_9PEZI|nr:uncharacterized protein PV09_01844 [Verruconis gallopava]KIW07940.1 hypothetical protein PV09_01844 [Verruconis gallopava]